MIRRRNFVPVDPQGQERLSEELWPFDLAANEGDICRYAAGCIPTHWHREPELFILLGGEVRIRAGGDTLTLRAGEGCLINGSTLHGFTACSDPCPYRSIVFDPGLVAGEPGSIFDTKYVRPLLCGAPWQIVDARETVFFAAFDRAFSACAYDCTASDRLFTVPPTPTLTLMPDSSNTDDAKISANSKGDLNSLSPSPVTNLTKTHSFSLVLNAVSSPFIV